MTKIFITGATGYIGGDLLFALHKKYPNFSYTVLVRTPEKAKQVTDAYPDIRTVQGDNDSSDLLKEESAKADIVIHTADSSDHEGAARAIAEGLTEGHTKENPGYWLHTGGTGILCYFDSKDGKFGEENDKVFNDWSGVDELVNLPKEAWHRNVDEIVLDCGIKNASSVKTAIVCPPTIYGVGRGPSLTRGRQVYELAKATLQEKKAPILGAGKARWNNVHVHDLSDAFVLLVDAILAKNDDKELWGDKGYYFTENGEHYWGLLAKWIAQTAADLGYIPEAATQQMDQEKVKALAGEQGSTWAWNSRGKAERFNKVLGWKPQGRSLEDEAATIVASEYRRLQQEK